MRHSARYFFRTHIHIVLQDAFLYQAMVVLICYTVTMQKTATKIFIYSSIVFGILGVLMVLTEMDPDENNTGFELVVTKLFMASVFIILSSFALSVATKYLNGKS